MPIAPESLVAALAAAYKVDRELGVGGMATVYLAHDLKHDRDVAIKVLHPELGAALGADRFLSEIRTTAKLQHPHILPLLDSGSLANARGDAEWLYYVMPLVTGETLRARLERERQLPIAECVRIAREVASALDYAHRQGVVHRDIKPENILLHDGSALVADFGIALAVQSASGQRMTQTGLSLGTPQYMSPEQAMGERSIDARSDVYSLGAVTYEMLTGEPPFAGATVQAIVAKVLTERPVPVTTTREMVSAGVEHAVLTALAKLPADRFSTAAEFSAALGDQAFIASSSTAPGGRVSPRDLRTRLRDPLVLALGALTIALAATVLMLVRRPATEPFPFRMELTTGDVTVVGEAAIAPGGNAVVFIGSSNACAPRCLFLQRLDQLEPRLLAGTSNAANPAFSPDGKWIAFIANRSTLKKLPVDGGDVASLAKVSEWSPTGWTSTNELIFGSGIDEGRQGLLRINAAGGEAVPLTQVDTVRGDHSHQAPIVLADGRTVLFTILKGARERSELALTSVDDGRVYPLGITATRAVGMVDGRLLYGRADGVLMAVPFDVRSRHLSGTAVPVLDSMGLGFAGDGSGADVNGDGGLVYVRGSPAHRLVWVDRAGHATPAIAEARDFMAPRISPNGRQAALSVRSGTSTDVWITDFGGTLTRLTTAPGVRNPVWSGDGRRVLFVSTEGGRPEIWSQAIDGSGPAVRIRTPAHNAWNIDVTPDGHTAMFNSLDERTSWDVYTLTLDSAATERAFVASPKALETNARFSPDGRSALYASNESGRPEIYVRAFGDSGSRVQISTGGSNKGVWSRDGRTVFYREGDVMMAAALARDPALRVVSRTPMFSGPFAMDFDVAPDGTRFLMVERVDERGAGMKLVVVPNWKTELRKRLGAGRE